MPVPRVPAQPAPSPAAIRLALCLPFLTVGLAWAAAALWPGHAPLAPPEEGTGAWAVLERLYLMLLAAANGLPTYLPLFVAGLVVAGRWPWRRLRWAAWLAPLVHAALTTLAIELTFPRPLVDPGTASRAATIAAWVLLVGYAHVGVAMLLLRCVGRHRATAASS